MKGTAHAAMLLGAVVLAVPALGVPPVYFSELWPYKSFDDSGLKALGDYWPLGLERFEAGKISVPGLTISPGFVLCDSLYIDSVDEDDGSIDGYGREGCTWYVNAPKVTVSFDKETLGYYPTSVGIAWTDIGGGSPRDGYGKIRFAVYDEIGTMVGERLYEEEVGDGQRTGETAEDRLVLVTWYGGIGAVSMTVETSSDWELDHVQWVYVCRADCTYDGKLDINDYICFQRWWRLREPGADYNYDGKFDVNDFIAYKADFTRGCYFK